jgi:hypothetical protein
MVGASSRPKPAPAMRSAGVMPSSVVPADQVLMSSMPSAASPKPPTATIRRPK